MELCKNIDVSESGSIRGLTLEDGREIKSHFYIDCTGFKRIIARRLNLKWREARGAIKHNSAIITANSYTDPYKEMHTYTTNAAQDYGWMFRIPLLDRKSFGYVFNSEQVSQERILEELDTVSNPATRVVDPFVLKWNPGSYEDAWSGNYCLIGLASSFVEAFEGSAIILQMQQIDMLTRFINNPVAAAGAPARFSQHLLDTMESISQRIDLSFGLAPRDNTDYWRHNHSVAGNIDLLEIINDYRHSPHAMFNNKFLPWQDHFYYFTAVYYGIDLSSRLRNSDANTLALAEHYFANQSKLNQLRAQISPREVDWFKSQQGVV